MKQLYLVFSALCISILGFCQPVLPVDFETPVTFSDFGGGAATVIVNPHATGINTSAHVGQMIKNADQVYGGSFFGLKDPIDFTTNKIFRMKVYSPRIGAKVLLKLENPTNAQAPKEVEVSTTIKDDWEDLSFDFSSVAVPSQYQRVVLIFDNGTNGDGSANFTFLFDDLRLTAGGGGGGGLTQMNLPVTFDLATVDYGLKGFGGVAATIVVDPTDAANKVGKAIKSNVAETYGGVTVTTSNDAGFSSKIPFTATDKVMTVRVWSPDAGIPVRLKVEDHTDPTKSAETESTVTVASGWQTMQFNFANSAPGTAALNLALNYDKVTIFFNFGTTGAAAGEKTYYFDDVKFESAGGGGLTQMNLPITFDVATVDYGLVGFGGVDGSIVTDPTDAANKVGKAVKSNVAELWGGVTVTAVTNNIQTGFSSKIPFTASNKKMTVRVWSPDAGIPVRLKVEDHTDGTKSAETEATVTVASGWQTLEFDFANTATGTAAFNLAFNYDKVSIFFNFGTTGAIAGEKTYYFDDVKMGVGPMLTQMNLPVTFDAAGIDYGVVGFEGAEASTIETDPTNAANKVVKVIKSNTAQFYAGTTVTAITNNVQTGFSSKIPFTILNRKMSVRIWSPDANIKVRLKVEDSNDPTKSVETQVLNTVAGGWETLVFDFGTQVPGTAALNLGFNYNKVTIFFNFDVTGQTAGAKTYYFDDVQFGVTLPVTLTSFNAEKKDNKALISWSTASETNNKGFSVQRSTDGQTWSEIGYVNGAGNSSAARNYSFTDAKPSAGINYYRLIQIDVNGNTKQSSIAALNFGRATSGIRVYPNPAKNVVNIISETITGRAAYRIINAEGKTMLMGNVNAGSNIIPVNISSLKAGTYMLLFTNDATVGNFKLLKL